MTDHRRQILLENGLQSAPPRVREWFWRRYNLSLRRRKVPAQLGELAARFVDQLKDEPEEVRRLDEAWRRVLPGNLASSSQVVGFSGGKLDVAVDGSAASYALGLYDAQALVELLNQVVGDNRIRTIVYQRGPGPRRAKQPAPSTRNGP